MPTALGLTTDKPATQRAGSGPYVSSSTTMTTTPRLDTISKRNHASAREMETLLWRALCDDPADTLRAYLAHDCVMINPLLAPGGSCEPLSKDSRPSVVDVLVRAAQAKEFQGFRFHGEPVVVEVDLMAVGLVYKVSLFRRGRKGGVREVVASVSSTWRQTAGAEWLLVLFHVAYADEEEEE
ncbi:hypothetical protein B0I37DRAFT_373186 [Chaetomium sp. MPI-CAGE-AT-0009]|nr:hypothetical protein B0I37DRAFT_373186 [Chaetomium sp. MPI-CAGE-AT-0009]